MEKTVNMIIEDIKMDIYNILNRDKLPISIYALILDQINYNIQQEYRNTLILEQRKYQEELNKEQKGEIENENR